jgi:formamidopyrimidine-DNA glycosylase
MVLRPDAERAVRRGQEGGCFLAMLELPEALVVADQLARTVIGKPVANVVAGHSPHRFAFFTGDPGDYDGALRGRVAEGAVAVGGFVELRFGGTSLILNDGANVRYHEPDSARPSTHQLLVAFEDGSALTVTVQMYAGLMCIPTGAVDNPYYLAAASKPSPLTDAFDREWFCGLLAPPEVQRLSVKAALATEQRIPGFGNGVLQDVLWRAHLHPRRRVSTVDDAEVDALFSSVTGLLREMAENGGRDTEVDLFGAHGQYRTVMSRLHMSEPCPTCGGPKVKQAYLGGSVYFCPGCQRA